jgi:CheY-like chemotaxis protein
MTAKDNNNPDILILSDQQDEIDDLVNLLAPRFGVPRSSLNAHDAARIIKEIKPGVVIFAFQRVGDVPAAQDVLNTVLRDLKLYKPQRLLMCKASESEQAYALYSNGLIDDFIADRPLYDPNRLRLSVSQALERRQYRLVSSDLLKVIERIDADMLGLDQFVSRLIESVDEKHHESIEMFHYLTHKVVSELADLHDGLVQRQQVGESGGRTTGDDSTPRDDGLNKTADWLVELSRDYKKSHSEPRMAPPELQKTGIRVLLVDDDDFYRDVFVSMMQGSGFDIETADHGGTAIDMARKNPPDIILLDYKMPGIDGLEVLDILNSEQAMRNIPVIMLTGISSKYIVDRSVKGGARDFIVKPGSRDVILRKIIDVVGRGKASTSG